MSRVTCRGTTTAGKACRAKLGLSEDGLCLQHDPLRTEQAAALRRAGGEALKAQRAREAEGSPPPENLPDEMDSHPRAAYLADWAAQALLRGEITVQKAQVLAQLVREFSMALERHHAREEEIHRLGDEEDRKKVNPRRRSLGFWDPLPPKPPPPPPKKTTTNSPIEEQHG